MIQLLTIGILGVIGWFVAIFGHVNSLCQGTERLLYFQDKHRTTQAFVRRSHFWSHSSLITWLVYSCASARRTAPRFGELPLDALISKDNQQMPLSRSITFPWYQKKERLGTKNHKINATYETTDEQTKKNCHRGTALKLFCVWDGVGDSKPVCFTSAKSHL